MSEKEIRGITVMEGNKMAVENQYLSDVETILSHRHDNGADLWATPDKRLLKGAPFSTFDCVLYYRNLECRLKILF